MPELHAGLPPVSPTCCLGFMFVFFFFPKSLSEFGISYFAAFLQQTPQACWLNMLSRVTTPPTPPISSTFRQLLLLLFLFYDPLYAIFRHWVPLLPGLWAFPGSLYSQAADKLDSCLETCSGFSFTVSFTFHLHLNHHWQIW